MVTTRVQLPIRNTSGSRDVVHDGCVMTDRQNYDTIMETAHDPRGVFDVSLFWQRQKAVPPATAIIE